MNKLTVFNAESAYYYFTDSLFRNSILGSSLLYCDSASLSYALRLRGVPHSRLHGPDFMDHYLCCFKSERVMIIGGSTQAHDHIRKRYQLNHVKFIDWHVSAEDLGELLSELESFYPQMVFVCLGLRKQETIANAIWQYFNSCDGFENATVIGVGAAVDFLGGTKIRSGRFWQSRGLEWLPRLVREPRMAPRILRSLVGCAMAFIKCKKFEADNLSFAKQFGF